MPNIESTKKALRQTKKHTARNKNYKNRIKQLTREMDSFVKEGKKDEAAKLLPVFYKAVDKAAKQNILHQNTASRKKARASRITATQ